MQSQPLLYQHQIHDHIPNQHRQRSNDEPVVNPYPCRLAVPREEAQPDERCCENSEGDGDVADVGPHVLRQVLRRGMVGEFPEVFALGFGDGGVVDGVDDGGWSGGDHDVLWFSRSRPFHVKMRGSVVVTVPLPPPSPAGTEKHCREGTTSRTGTGRAGSMGFV